MSEPVDNSVPYPFFATLKDRNAILVAENERLRTAGDAMAYYIKNYTDSGSFASATIRAWLAAKGGIDKKAWSGKTDVL